MKIYKSTIKPGETKTISLDIARLHTRTSIEIPVVVSRAKKEGPCLLLIAGIHGDEVNGVEIVRQIISKGYHKPTRGTIICMPVVNVFGFLNQEREFPDGRDLNRSFPGSRRGSLASRFAYHIVKYVTPHVDVCVDYHTGGGARFNYSQVRLDKEINQSLDLAKAFGTKFIINAKNRKGSLRKTLGEKGIRTVLYEGGKAIFLDRSVTQAGLEGSLKIIHELGMGDYSDYPFQKISDMQYMITESKWIRAKYSGMLRMTSRVGSFVEEGQILGSISDPYGSFEDTIIAPNDGFLLCNNHASIINQGDAIIHISEAFDSL